MLNRMLAIKQQNCTHFTISDHSRRTAVSPVVLARYKVTKKNLTIKPITNHLEHVKTKRSLVLSVIIKDCLPSQDTLAEYF